MPTLLRFGAANIAVSFNESAASVTGSDSLLTQWVDHHSGNKLGEPQTADASPELEIIEQADGIHLKWHTAAKKPLLFHIDVSSFTQQQYSFPAPKQGAFNQALGKKTRSVIDATGGWGGDALLMCAQGYRVTILERHPIMALLLSDSMRRLGRTPWARDNPVCVPEVIFANATDALNNLDLEVDCVYLDPMFPPKRKKSAAVNKQMQLLQWLVGEDQDASNVVKTALAKFSRVAVKRPDYAQPLLRDPDTQFSSKLVHYDVYFA